MGTCKNFRTPYDIYERERFTSIWYIRDQWVKYKEDYDKYCKQIFVGGRYRPNRLTSPEDKVKIWANICALTKVAKDRCIWNYKTQRVDVSLADQKIIQLDDHRHNVSGAMLDTSEDVMGTTLLQLIRENRAAEERAKEEKAKKKTKPPRIKKPGYMLINPNDGKAWMRYWREHTDQQSEMIEYRQEILNKRMSRKRKREKRELAG